MHETFDMINALACMGLMVYGFIAAVGMKGGMHRLWQKLMFLSAMFAFGVQAMSPWLPSVPYAEWPAMLGNLTLLTWVTVWRHEAWGFVLCKFGEPPARNPGRRRSDIEALSTHQMNRVVGGSKQ